MPQRMLTGVPSGISRARRRRSALRRAMHPWEIRPGIRLGTFVPWMPMQPPPGQSVRIRDRALRAEGHRAQTGRRIRRASRGHRTPPWALATASVRRDPCAGRRPPAGRARASCPEPLPIGTSARARTWCIAPRAERGVAEGSRAGRAPQSEAPPSVRSPSTRTRFVSPSGVAGLHDSDGRRLWLSGPLVQSWVARHCTQRATTSESGSWPYVARGGAGREERHAAPQRGAHGRCCRISP